jgi:hypothetical protein
VDVELHPSYSSATYGDYAYYEVTLTSDANVLVSTVEILLEWDVSPSAPLRKPKKTNSGHGKPPTPPTMELVETVPLGIWQLTGFPNDPDGQALYVMLGPLGSPQGSPMSTPNGTPILRLKFRVWGTGSVNIVPEAGDWALTRVFAADVPNHDVTGINEDVATAHLCCGC